jgi:hypothetical protein
MHLLDILRSTLIRIEYTHATHAKYMWENTDSTRGTRCSMMLHTQPVDIHRDEELELERRGGGGGSLGDRWKNWN